MAEVELKLLLPDSLAREAEANGLLTPESIETLLRNELRRRQRVNQLFEAADNLAALDLAPLSESELEEEIRSTTSSRTRPNTGLKATLSSFTTDDSGEASPLCIDSS